MAGRRHQIRLYLITSVPGGNTIGIEVDLDDLNQRDRVRIRYRDIDVNTPLACNRAELSGVCRHRYRLLTLKTSRRRS